MAAAKPFPFEKGSLLARFNECIPKIAEQIETSRNSPAQDKPGGLNECDHVSAPSCGVFAIKPGRANPPG
jgi:hypothetical protein